MERVYIEMLSLHPKTTRGTSMLVPSYAQGGFQGDQSQAGLLLGPGKSGMKWQVNCVMFEAMLTCALTEQDYLKNISI